MRRFMPAGTAILAAAAILGPAAAASALDFDMTGWWRTRYHLISATPVDPSGGSNTTEFLDMRMTLYPTLTLTDKIKIKSRLDILDNVIWGQNEDEPSILTGLSDATSEFDRELEPVDDIQVERLYGEIHTPIGILEAGRMPLQWGLGILANSADALEWGNTGTGPEGGDTVDQVLFVTDAGVPLGWKDEHWILGLAYDRPVELNVWAQGDDVDQAYLVTLYTNGTLSPKRIVGSREIGAIVIYLHNSDNEANVALGDVYFHFDLGDPAPGGASPVFFEGEGVLGVGKARRGGLLPENKKQEFADNIEEGLADGGLPPQLAHDIADHGTDIGLVQQLVAEGLVEEGFSEEVALTIASQGAGAGFDQARQQELEALIGGAVVRGGYRAEGAKLTVEMGYSTGGGTDEALPNFIGPQASTGTEANGAIDDAFASALTSIVTGSKVEAYPFDTEWDPALILYDEVGPLDPVTFRPTVQNTIYVKGAFEYDIDDRTGAYASVVWGRLNRSVETFRVTGADDSDPDTPVEVVSAGKEKDLGIEIDAGIYRSFYENFRAELKLGYLFTGKAFGPEAEGIFAVRPQIAILF